MDFNFNQEMINSEDYLKFTTNDNDDFLINFPFFIVTEPEFIEDDEELLVELENNADDMVTASEIDVEHKSISPEIRTGKIARYMEKKKRRKWSTKSFYKTRHIVAVNRQRVNGRFAANNVYG